jgi:hypothetical protein
MVAILQEKWPVRQGSSRTIPKYSGSPNDPGTREPHNIDDEFQRNQFAHLGTITGVVQ